MRKFRPPRSCIIGGPVVYNDAPSFDNFWVRVRDCHKQKSSKKLVVVQVSNNKETKLSI